VVIDWFREKLPCMKGQPLILSWSWKCDPEMWLTEKLNRLFKKRPPEKKDQEI